MKKLFSFMALLISFSTFLFLNASAQTPQGVNYQAVARDAGGNILANQNICIRSTITNGNGGPDVYIETFNAMTNQFGLFTLNIGNGTPVAIPFNTISWGTITPWQKVEIDIGCLGSYTVMGSSPLLSVPYSLYSLQSEKTSVVGGTVNYVSKFTAADAIGNSQIYDDGTGVGIGTTGPTAKLDVNHSGNGMAARINSADKTYLGIYEGNTYRGWLGSFYGAIDDMEIGSVSGAVNFMTGGNIDMTVDAGKIGIGITSPSVPLDVNKPTTGQVLKLNATDQVYLGFYEASTYRGYVGSFYGNAADVDLGSQSGAVHLVTGGTIDLTADAGDIGIGITSPAAKLDINSTGTGQTIKVNAASDVFMGFWEGGGYRGYVGSYYGGIADMDLGSLAGSVHLVTGSSIDLTAKAGDIGIGTTTPARKLEVYDNTGDAYARITTNFSNTSAHLELVRTTGGTQWSIYNNGALIPTLGNLVIQSNNTRDEIEIKSTGGGDGYLQPGYDTMMYLGNSSNRWITVYAQNGTINTSDVREKSNISDLNYGLPEVMRLRPVTFTWTGRPQWGTKIGLIAQEVKDVVKEVVVHGNLGQLKDENGNLMPNPDKYGIFYSDLIPVLIKSIQDQQKIIESQDARIKALEEQVD